MKEMKQQDCSRHYLNPYHATEPQDSKGDNWIIVLAIGNVLNKCSGIYRWYGADTPQKFCTYVDSQSILEHTWSCARAIVAEKNIVTITLEEHRAHIATQSAEPSADSIPGRIMYQPANRGTAAAIFLGLANILAEDPDARVMVLPADYFIYPEAPFIAAAKQCFQYSQQIPNKAILLGAEAKWSNPEYGWIETQRRQERLPRAGEQLSADNSMLLSVRRYSDKPDQSKCNELYLNGAFWSTRIFTVNGEMLWRMAQEYLPMMAIKMNYIREIFNFYAHNEIAFKDLQEPLRLSYYNLIAQDFAAEFIQPAARNFCVLPLGGIDLYRPEQVVADNRGGGGGGSPPRG